MKSFMTLFILQGIVNKPFLQMYFSTRESISALFIGKLLNSNKFSLLYTFLHFVGYINISPGKVVKIRTDLKIFYKNENVMDICVDCSLRM